MHQLRHQEAMFAEWKMVGFERHLLWTTILCSSVAPTPLQGCNRKGFGRHWTNVGRELWRKLSTLKLKVLNRDENLCLVPRIDSSDTLFPSFACATSKGIDKKSVCNHIEIETSLLSKNAQFASQWLFDTDKGVVTVHISRCEPRMQGQWCVSSIILRDSPLITFNHFACGALRLLIPYDFLLALCNAASWRVLSSLPFIVCIRLAQRAGQELFQLQKMLQMIDSG